MLELLEKIFNLKTLLFWYGSGCLAYILIRGMRVKKFRLEDITKEKIRSSARIAIYIWIMITVGFILSHT
jgi:hypothetical protein